MIRLEIRRAGKIVAPFFLPFPTFSLPFPLSHTSRHLLALKMRKSLFVTTNRPRKLNKFDSFSHGRKKGEGQKCISSIWRLCEWFLWTIFITEVDHKLQKAYFEWIRCEKGTQKKEVSVGVKKKMWKKFFLVASHSQNEIEIEWKLNAEGRKILLRFSCVCAVKSFFWV